MMNICLRRPAHWANYSPDEQRWLREHQPVNWDDLGSSARDLWESRQLQSLASLRTRRDQTV